MAEVSLSGCGLYESDGSHNSTRGDVELVHQPTPNNASDIGMRYPFRQIDKPNRSQLFKCTREIGLGHAHGLVKRLVCYLTLIINAVNLGRAKLTIAQLIVCGLAALVRRQMAWRWKGVDAKLGAMIDIRTGRERATVESARSARIGGRIEVICVRIGGVEILARGDARVGDDLRAQASIEGLLKQIRSCRGEELGSRRGKC